MRSETWDLGVLMTREDWMVHGDRCAFTSAFAVVVCLGAALGCDGDGDRRFGDVEDVDVTPSAETMYTVGALDGATWETFGEVSSVAFGHDGTLFVLDEDPARVVAFDTLGRYQRTISREGGGPGEVRQPGSVMVFSDGRIGVWDYAKDAVLIFDADGRFLDATPYDPSQGVPALPIYAMDDQSLVAIQTTGATRQGAGRSIARFNLDGSRDVLHRAWERPASDQDVGRQVGVGGLTLTMTGGASAFPVPVTLGVLGSGRLVVSDSIGYRIKVLASDGSVVQTVDRRIAPISVTPKMQIAERERQLARIDVDLMGGSTITVSGGGGTVDPVAVRNALLDAAKQRIDALMFPNEIPVIERLAVDWSDRIWVQRAAPPNEEGPIDVLTADGSYMGTIAPGRFRMPAAFGPNDMIAYVELGEMGIQRVRVAVLRGL